MTTLTHYLCVGCPLGCRLEVEEDQDRIVAIRGFSCKLGKEYAQREHTDPRRLVTTTVAVEGGRWARLPVKTTGLVPRRDLKAVCRAIHRVRLRAPVALGDIVARDILGTGVDVIATRDLPSAPNGSA